MNQVEIEPTKNSVTVENTKNSVDVELFYVHTDWYYIMAQYPAPIHREAGT